jgi:hypothetical protein
MRTSNGSTIILPFSLPFLALAGVSTRGSSGAEVDIVVGAGDGYYVSGVGRPSLAGARESELRTKEDLQGKQTTVVSILEEKRDLV